MKYVEEFRCLSGGTGVTVTLIKQTANSWSPGLHGIIYISCWSLACFQTVPISVLPDIIQPQSRDCFQQGV